MSLNGPLKTKGSVFGRLAAGWVEPGHDNCCLFTAIKAVASPVFALTFALIFGAVPAAAYDTRYPDWPCQQPKVPELSIAAVWPEPIPEKAGDSASKIPGLDDLVAKLAARKTPMEEAEKDISSFITGTPEERKQKADLLFVGLFDALNSQRFQVMNGVERAYRSQKDLADNVRTDVAKLRTLQDTNNGDSPEEKDLVARVQWETRIFDDRRKTLTYACQVPVEIDQRIFALARAIQKAGGIS